MATQHGGRQKGTIRAVSTVPSINKTPGPGTPPLPYPVTNDLSSSSGTVSNVKFNGSPAFVLSQSTIPTVMGDQPGSVGGIKSGTVGGKVEPTKGSTDVRAGGKWVIRPLDPCTLNSGNTIGIFVPVPPLPLAVPGQPIPQPSRPSKPENEAEAAFLAKLKKSPAAGIFIPGLGKIPEIPEGPKTGPGSLAPTPTERPSSLSAPKISGGTPDQVEMVRQSIDDAIKQIDSVLENCLPNAKKKPNDLINHYFGIEGTSPEDIKKIDEIANNYKKIKHNILNPKYKIHPNESTGASSSIAYVYTMPIIKGFGGIHINFPNFSSQTSADRASTITHEASHYYLNTDDHAYSWQHKKWNKLTQEQKIDNADSYGGFARDCHSMHQK